MPCAAPPHFREQHNLTALDLVFEFHECHRFSLLSRNGLNRHDHTCDDRLTLISCFSKIHQTVNPITFEQVLEIIKRMARQIQP
ncbi:hypothetical protein D3C78_1471610 [compost metagenome]